MPVSQKIQPVKTVPPGRAVTVHQAVENSPALGRLAELVKDSSARLDAIKSLIPLALHPAVRAGPIDGQTWCLLVSGNAAAAKVRQLMPLLLSRLTALGWEVTSIRLKILMGPRR
jgi:hypothetical protein